jgi:hypothetical protein
MSQTWSLAEILATDDASVQPCDHGPGTVPISMLVATVSAGDHHPQDFMAMCMAMSIGFFSPGARML